MSKKVLIIGCTGTMGRALADYWVQKGYDTWGICRSHCVINKAVHYMYGDATDEGFMRHVLESADFDAIVDFMWYDPKIFVNQIGLLLALTKHYICLSSCAVSAHSSTPIKETYPRFFDIASESEKNDIGWHYHLEKARIENIICLQEHRNWSIIRPHVTINSNHMPLTIWGEDVWLWRAVHNLPIIVYEDLLKPISSYTIASDVAQIIDAIINNGASSFGETYNVVSDTVLSGEQLLNMYIEILQKQGVQMKVIRFQDSSSFYQWSPSRAERITFDRAKDRVFDNTKIKEITHFEFENFEESLNKCILLWLSQNNSEYISSQLINEMAFIDRMTNTRTPLKYFQTRKDQKNYIISRYPLLRGVYNKFLQPLVQIAKKIIGDK